VTTENDNIVEVSNGSQRKDQNVLQLSLLCHQGEFGNVSTSAMTVITMVQSESL